MKRLMILLLLLFLVIIVLQNFIAYSVFTETSAYRSSSWVSNLEQSLPIVKAINAISNSVADSLGVLNLWFYEKYNEVLRSGFFESFLMDVDAFYSKYLWWVFVVLKVIIFLTVPLFFIGFLLYVGLLIFSKKAAKRFLEFLRYAITEGVWESPVVVPIITFVSGIFKLFAALVTAAGEYALSLSRAAEVMFMGPIAKINLWSAHYRNKIEESVGDKIRDADLYWDKVLQDKHETRIRRMEEKTKRQKERREAREKYKNQFD